MKLKDHKQVIIVFLILILLLGFYLLFRDYLFVDQPVEQTDEDWDLREEIYLENSGLKLYSPDSTLKWELGADRIEYQKTEIIELQPVKIDVFDRVEEKKLLYTISAEQGIYRENEKKLILKKNVEIDQQLRERKLKVERLIWDQEQNLVYGEQGFLLTTPVLRLEGGSFKSDLRFDNLEITEEEGQTNLQFREE